MHVAILLLLLIPASACAQSSKPQSKPVIGGQVSLPETADPIARKRPAIAEDASATSRLTGKINAARAMQYNREVVAFGPRPIGSVAHRKLESYLRSHLKGDTVEEDVFTAETPVGKFAMRNFIAKFPGTKDGVIVVGGHYDTNYGLKNYVGANDGGSSTALLLELANQLRTESKGKPREGYSVWLVWFDGEEAVQQWSHDDSLYGSRHLADKWKQQGTLSKLKAFLLVDMIGDSDLNIEREQNSTSWLEDLLYQAARKQGYQSHFFGRATAIEDDHLPFVALGVPSADIIDLNYGPDNSYHHTPQDIMDKVSPKSLEITGNTVLSLIGMLDQK